MLSRRRRVSISNDEMLSIYIHDQARALTFRLIGGLFGADAVEVEQAWKTASPTLKNRELVIDLTEVTELDAGGSASLRRFAEEGARFITASTLTDSAVMEASGRSPAVLPAPHAGIWRRLACSLASFCRLAGTVLRPCLPCGQRIRRFW